MTVYLSTKLWPDSRVPYVLLNDKNGDAAAWFKEVNECIEFDLLVPEESTDINYIQVEVGGYSRSEWIGCKGTGMQTIGGTQKATVLHELLHALGFKHEQLHKGFPWDDKDPNVKSVNRMFSYNGKIKNKPNQDLYDAIAKRGGKGGAFFADNNLMSRVEAILDPNTVHWRACDGSSVMMYPDFRDVLEELKLIGQPYNVISSGASAKCNALSNQDVDALKYMYPRPHS